MASKRVKRVLGCLGVLLAVTAALWGLSGLVQRKDSDIKYHDFFAQKEDFDVLFLGTSHVLNGIFPMELWKDQGIVSYNFGGHGDRIPTTYWAAKNAMDYTSPKLLVIDACFLYVQLKTSPNYSFVHISFDAFPFTATKYHAVCDLLDDKEMEKMTAEDSATQAEKREPIGLLWDFSAYHARWTELDKADFVVSPSVEKGAESRIAVSVPNLVERIPRGDKLEGETVGTQYLRRLIEECQQDGIEVLLVYLPFPAAVEHQRDANRLSDIADEYGVNSINFLDLDVVDYNTDCYDATSHLNPSGARKVTEYLGQYIKEHYDIPDRRGDPAYRGWYGDYAEYTEFKENNLKKQKGLDTYLMLLADKNYDFIFELKSKQLFEGGVYKALLENLGVDTSALTGAGSWLITRQGGQPAEVWPVGEDDAGEWRTALGGVRLQNDTITLDDEICLAPPAKGKAGELRIAVLAREDHRLADAVDFDLATKAALR